MGSLGLFSPAFDFRAFEVFGGVFSGLDFYIRNDPRQGFSLGDFFRGFNLKFRIFQRFFHNSAASLSYILDFLLQTLGSGVGGVFVFSVSGPGTPYNRYAHTTDTQVLEHRFITGTRTSHLTNLDPSRSGMSIKYPGKKKIRRKNQRGIQAAGNQASGARELGLDKKGLNDRTGVNSYQ